MTREGVCYQSHAEPRSWVRWVGSCGANCECCGCRQGSTDAVPLFVGHCSGHDLAVACRRSQQGESGDTGAQQMMSTISAYQHRPTDSAWPSGTSRDLTALRHLSRPTLSQVCHTVNSVSPSEAERAKASEGRAKDVEGPENPRADEEEGARGVLVKISTRPKRGLKRDPDLGS